MMNRDDDYNEDQGMGCVYIFIVALILFGLASWMWG